MIGAGIENILAGCVSTLKTFTDYVDPASFFGHSMTGAILGAGVSYALNRKKGKEALGRTVLGTSARSALLGALSSASGYFTAGAFLGFTAMQIGKIMAAHAQKEQMLCCSCSPLTFEQQLKTFSEDEFFREHWNTPPFLPEESLSIFDTPGIHGNRTMGSAVSRRRKTKQALFPPGSGKASSITISIHE